MRYLEQYTSCTVCACTGLGSGMEEVCQQLDSVLLEVMSSLQELSRLRERYSAAVKEVNSTL